MKIERKAPELTVKKSSDGSIRLNKYISNSGICSRREADVMIESGAVSVNNKVVTTMGFKVQPGDIVKCDGHTITPEKRQYVLLNKPKNFTAVMDDPLNRRSVAQLMKGACKEPVYPVGKMDRQTTGLLLFTNDGELSKKLNHPKQGVRTIYHITCKEKVKSTHLQEMIQGVEIEGYFVRADAVEYIGDGENPHEIGMEIKSSRVKSVERLFAHFGYSITKMDRVVFAHLTKKDLPRGRFRHLTKEEVNYLKMI
ncbi:MAG: pseudouridine synthase [Bacteroidota bacterium]